MASAQAVRNQLRKENVISSVFPLYFLLFSSWISFMNRYGIWVAGQKGDPQRQLPWGPPPGLLLLQGNYFGGTGLDACKRLSHICLAADVVSVENTSSLVT
jgi:hypothetical protein